MRSLRQKNDAPDDTPDIKVLSATRQKIADLTDKDNPLLVELEYLIDRYLKLARKLDRITRISDKYQVELREMNEKLDKASRTDPLTGLANRRDMIDALRNAIAEARKYGNITPSILLLDVDHFKETNDKYGHLAGDRVLVELAKTIDSYIGENGSVCRWGGEEFLILLPDCTVSRVRDIAEGLCKFIEVKPVIIDGGRCVDITVSIGGKAWNPGDDIDAWLRGADYMLYRSKSIGRNRISL